MRESHSDVERLLKDLEKSKVGDFGYEVLEHMMAKAAWHLNREILEALPRYEKAGV